jgi:hypothetical protein
MQHIDRNFFKAVMAVHHGVLPPTIKISKPNPKLGVEGSAFHLSTTARPWVRGGDHPRRASVSSFGFGGSNFHVAVEEYKGPGRRAPRRRVGPELVVLSAGTAAELIAFPKVTSFPPVDSRATDFVRMTFPANDCVRVVVTLPPRIVLPATTASDSSGDVPPTATANVVPVADDTVRLAPAVVFVLRSTLTELDK